MLRLFIGYDERERVAFHVLAHSIQRRSSVPISITPLNRATLAAVFDGKDMREAGLRGPKRAPVLLTMPNHTSTGVDTIDDGTDVWSLVTTPDKGTAIASTAEAPMADPTSTGVAYNRITLAADDADLVSGASGDVAYENVAFTMASTHTAIRFFLRIDGANKVLPAGTLALVLSTEAATSSGHPGGGTTKELIINEDIQFGDWRKIEVDYDGTAFTGAAIVLRIKKQLAPSLWNSSNDVVLRLGPVYAIDGAAGPFTGKVQARFTYYDPKRLRESDPSPPSYVLDTGSHGDGIGIQLDLSGFRGFWDALGSGLTDGVGANRLASNANPEYPDAPNVRIYLSLEEWGRDDDTGDAVWRLVGPREGIAAPTNLFDEDQTLSALVDIDAGSSANTTANRRIVAPEDSNTLIDGTETLHPWNAAHPACEFAILDGDRIALAGQQDFTTGLVNLTAGNDIVTLDPDGTGAVWGPWCVGRRFRVKGSGDADTDAKVYFVLDWIDNTHMRIGRDLNVFAGQSPYTQVYAEGYGGPTVTGASYVILGWHSRIWWSSKTAFNRSGVEYGAVLNFADAEMPNDQINGLGRVSDTLVVFGRRKVVRSRQNPVTDETDLPVYPRFETIEGAPGCDAPRSITAISPTRILYLGGGNKIIESNGASFQEHPLSQAIQGMVTKSLEGQARVNNLGASWATVLSNKGLWYVFLVGNGVVFPEGAVSGSRTGDPTAPTNPGGDPAEPAEYFTLQFGIVDNKSGTGVTYGGNIAVNGIAVTVDAYNDRPESLEVYYKILGSISVPTGTVVTLLDALTTTDGNRDDGGWWIGEQGSISYVIGADDPDDVEVTMDANKKLWAKFGSS